MMPRNVFELLAVAEARRDGLITPSGRDDDGTVSFKLTDKGRAALGAMRPQPETPEPDQSGQDNE